MTAGIIFSFKSKSGYTKGTNQNVYYSTDYVLATKIRNATLMDVY